MFDLFQFCRSIYQTDGTMIDSPPGFLSLSFLMMGPLRAPTVPLYIRSSVRAKQKETWGWWEERVRV